VSKKSDMIAVLEAAPPAAPMDDKPEGADADVMLATHLSDFKAALDSGDEQAAAAAFRAAVEACC
jgi:hypothetical protein